jgi:hypothetical protein
MTQANRELIQSCINSVGYPDFMAGFRGMVESRLRNWKTLFYCLNTDLFFDSETNHKPGIPKKNGTLGSWTAPSWFTEGDISFFYHSRRSLGHSRRLYNKLKAKLDAKDRLSRDLPDHLRPLADRLLIMLVATAKRGLEFAQKYNGKIFAIGRASGGFERNTPSADQHWKSNCYSEFDNVSLLDYPIDYDDFRDQVSLEQKAITPLTRVQFDLIRQLVLRSNSDVGYLAGVQHRDSRISDVAKNQGWRTVAKELNSCFLFEAQTREYLLDGFVAEISDEGTRVHTEIPSMHRVYGGGIIDYVITFAGSYLPIEAKCSIYQSDELRDQLRKYAGASLRLGRSKKDTSNCCLLVDSKNLFGFRMGADGNETLIFIDALSNLASLPKESINLKIREAIYGSH